ncbi:uncharacterized protein I303_107787 [Kwoniella dejecticola CBS 10117]|uniref:Uncharacterized protein n=1 Tax=Kwoniella dejecticola CBS 10117 TaxID=1296121 RepID=A0AAJ8KWH9_9TREE
MPVELSYIQKAQGRPSSSSSSSFSFSFDFPLSLPFSSGAVCLLEPGFPEVETSNNFCCTELTLFLGVGHIALQTSISFLTTIRFLVPQTILTGSISSVCIVTHLGSVPSV